MTPIENFTSLAQSRPDLLTAAIGNRKKRRREEEERRKKENEDRKKPSGPSPIPTGTALDAWSHSDKAEFDRQFLAVELRATTSSIEDLRSRADQEFVVAHVEESAVAEEGMNPRHLLYVIGSREGLRQRLLQLKRDGVASIPRRLEQLHRSFSVSEWAEIRSEIREALDHGTASD